MDLCLKKDGLGWQVFNAGNDGNSVPQPNSELLKAFFPNVALKRPVTETEALFSNAKVKSVLGFKEQHDWRRNV